MSCIISQLIIDMMILKSQYAHQYTPVFLLIKHYYLCEITDLINEMKWNKWCFRPRFCTVRLNWAADNMGNEMNFVDLTNTCYIEVQSICYKILMGWDKGINIGSTFYLVKAQSLGMVTNRQHIVLPEFFIKTSWQY